MLSFEIIFYPFTDFFSSQLHTEDTILVYAFPNIFLSCFAPVLHLVMHIAYSTTSLLQDKIAPLVHTISYMPFGNEERFTRV